MSWRSIAFLLVSILCAAAGQVFMRVGVKDREGFADMVNPVLAAGLALYAISTLLWILVISRVSLTLVYPATALTICLVYCASVLFLGETLSLGKVAGVLFIFLGLGCIWFTRH